MPILSDSFTGTNLATMQGRSLDTGQTWSQQTGSWLIVNNQAGLNTKDATRYYITADSGLTDVDISVDCLTPSNSFSAGAVFRLVDTNNWYAAVFDSARGGVALIESVAGTRTVVKTATIATLVSGSMHTLRVIAQGTSIRVLADGVEVLTHTSVTPAANATRVGLSEYRESVNFNGMLMDNFTVDAPATTAQVQYEVETITAAGIARLYPYADRADSPRVSSKYKEVPAADIAAYTGTNVPTATTTPMAVNNTDGWVELDVTLPDSTIGYFLTYRQQDSSNRFDMNLSSTGAVRFYTLVAGTRTLRFSSSTGLWANGTRHRVLVRVEGNSHALYVDDVYINGYTDPNAALSGNVNVFGGTTSTRHKLATYPLRVMMDAPVTVPTSPPVNRTAIYRVTQSNHDGYNHATTTGLAQANTQLYVGDSNSSLYDMISYGLMTPDNNEGVPVGIVPSKAELVLTEAAARGDSKDFRVTFQNADNPVIPATHTELRPGGLPRLTGIIYNTNESWAQDKVIRIDVTSMIRTIMARSGRTAASRVQAFLEYITAGYVENNIHAIWSYDTDPAKAMRLEVEYQVPVYNAAATANDNPPTGAGTGSVTNPGYTSSGFGYGTVSTGTGAASVTAPSYDGAGSASDPTIPVSQGVGSVEGNPYSTAGVANDPAPTASGTGNVTNTDISAVGAATANAPTASGEGFVLTDDYGGVGTATDNPPVGSGIASVDNPAYTTTSTATDTAPTASGTGTLTQLSYSAVGTITETPPVATGVASVTAASYDSVGAATDNPPTGAGTGQLDQPVYGAVGTANDPSPVAIGSVLISNADYQTIGIANDNPPTATGTGTMPQPHNYILDFVSAASSATFYPIAGKTETRIVGKRYSEPSPPHLISTINAPADGYTLNAPQIFAGFANGLYRIDVTRVTANAASVEILRFRYKDAQNYLAIVMQANGGIGIIEYVAGVLNVRASQGSTAYSQGARRTINLSIFENVFRIWIDGNQQTSLIDNSLRNPAAETVMVMGGGDITRHGLYVYPAATALPLYLSNNNATVNDNGPTATGTGELTVPVYQAVGTISDNLPVATGTAETYPPFNYMDVSVVDRVKPLDADAKVTAQGHRAQRSGFVISASAKVSAQRFAREDHGVAAGSDVHTAAERIEKSNATITIAVDAELVRGDVAYLISGVSIEGTGKIGRIANRSQTSPVVTEGGAESYVATVRSGVAEISVAAAADEYVSRSIRQTSDVTLNSTVGASSQRHYQQRSSFNLRSSVGAGLAKTHINQTAIEPLDGWATIGRTRAVRADGSLDVSVDVRTNTQAVRSLSGALSALAGTAEHYFENYQAQDSAVEPIRVTNAEIRDGFRSSETIIPITGDNVVTLSSFRRHETAFDLEGGARVETSINHTQRGSFDLLVEVEIARQAFRQSANDLTIDADATQASESFQTKTDGITLAVRASSAHNAHRTKRDDVALDADTFPFSSRYMSSTNAVAPIRSYVEVRSVNAQIGEHSLTLRAGARVTGQRAQALSGELSVAVAADRAVARSFRHDSGVLPIEATYRHERKGHVTPHYGLSVDSRLTAVSERFVGLLDVLDVAVWGNSRGRSFHTNRLGIEHLASWQQITSQMVRQLHDGIEIGYSYRNPIIGDLEPSDYDSYLIAPGKDTVIFDQDTRRVMKRLEKDPNASLSYFFRFDNYLKSKGVKLANVHVFCDSPDLNISNVVFTPEGKVRALIEGGVALSTYILVCRITMDSGEVDDRSVKLEVKNL